MLELFLYALFIFIIIFILFFLYFYLKYYLSGYEQAGGYSFFELCFSRNNSKSIGIYGEYKTYLELMKFKLRGSKILVNLYIFNNEIDSTEIDLIMIDKTGIYVFESKNMSGSIYGKPSDRNWTQRLGNMSNSFPNPINQNMKHIKYLDNFLDNKYTDNIYSFIVFSERCKLKKVIYHDNVRVVKRENLIYNIKNRINNSNIIFTKEEIDDIYNKLSICINVSADVKLKHVENIKNKKNIVNSYLKKIDLNVGMIEYQMYQDMPKEENGRINSLVDIDYEDFKSMMNYYMKCETEIDPKIESCTNRYIYYVNDKPVGEILVRTTINERYLNRSSQIYFKVRISERNKGYATKMLELCLKECKKIGFDKVYLNCGNDNIPAKYVILNNGGIKVKEHNNITRYEINIK